MVGDGGLNEIVCGVAHGVLREVWDDVNILRLYVKMVFVVVAEID